MRGITHRAAGICASGAIGMLQGLSPKDMAIVTAGVVIGSLLPDIDSRKSIISQAVKPVGAIVSTLAGHRTLFHDPAFYGLIFAALWVLNRGLYSWFLPLFIGIGTHLLLDVLTTRGLPFAFKWRLRFFPIESGGWVDTILLCLFTCMGGYFIVNWSIAEIPPAIKQAAAAILTFLK